MSPRTVRERLQDMASAMDRVAALVSEAGGDDAAAVPLTIVEAILYNLQIIGEAAGHLDEGVRRAIPEIPWQDLRELRNVVSHEYFRFDAGAVWRLAHSDLPRMRHAIGAWLAMPAPPGG